MTNLVMTFSWIIYHSMVPPYITFKHTHTLWMNYLNITQGSKSTSVAIKKLGLYFRLPWDIFDDKYLYGIRLIHRTSVSDATKYVVSRRTLQAQHEDFWVPVDEQFE